MLSPAHIQIVEEEYQGWITPKVTIANVLLMRLLYLKHGSDMFENLSKHEASFIAPELFNKKTGIERLESVPNPEIQLLAPRKECNKN